MATQCKTFFSGHKSCNFRVRLWCKAIGAVHHELKMAAINCLTMTVQGSVYMEVGDLGQVSSPAWVG